MRKLILDIEHPSGLGGRRQLYDLGNGLGAAVILDFPGSTGHEVHPGHITPNGDAPEFAPDYQVNPEVNGLDAAGVEAELDRLEAL